jgi:anti-anti-sigma factor
LDIGNIPTFSNQLEAIKNTDEYAKLHDIVLDLAKLEFMDSSGIGKLVYLQKEMQKDDKKLYIKNIPDNIKQVFEITRVSNYFNILADSD